MKLLTLIIVILIIIIVIYYYINIKIENFNNYKDPYNSIYNIKSYYKLLKNEMDDNARDLIKKRIKDSIIEIENSLINDYDKYKLNNIYHNELVPLLNKEYSKNNNDKFQMIINYIMFIINESLDPVLRDHTAILNDIKNNFKILTNLYSDVYITNTYSYIKVETQIDKLIKKIYDGLLKITTHEDLNYSGILLILNTTLKRAYETNDITQINSLINSFNEKIKKININIRQDLKDDSNDNIFETNFPASILDATTTVSINKDNKIIKLIQEDFSKIYNSFDIINEIYANNGNLKQIPELNKVIYNAIDNIISYNKNDNGYKTNINTIKNVIIEPILEGELYNTYRNNNKDSNNIIKIKNKFYDGIIEIKNIIINSYAKTRNNVNRDFCLRDIINAILNNNYPIKVKKLNGCKDLSFLSNDELIIHPKLAISRDKGKSWGNATDYIEFKKTGESNDPYLFTYKLATTNNGKNWSFL